jgi:hypothetical protein
MLTRALPASVALLVVFAPALLAQDAAPPPAGPSPYEVVTGWHQPFATPGYAFGGNSGVFAESPDRIFVLMRGETRLPSPIPPEYAGHAGSIGINVLRARDLREWRNCIYTLDGDGIVQEIWTQWDHLCAESGEGDGPHRIRISPYDPERRVWVINETTHQIHVFSNDGSQLHMTLGEKHVAGDDETRFARPQDVAFLPDGRVLVADGLDNHRVVLLDREGRYLSEVGGHGDGPGQFNGVHAVATGPGDRIYALDRSGGRINVFRTTEDPARLDFVDVWDGLNLPLDIIVNDEHLWITDLTPLRFIKFDFDGNQLYSWTVPREMPDGFLEIHTFSVDAEGNLFAGDNQYGRTQKLVPRPDADPALIIGSPWFER